MEMVSNMTHLNSSFEKSLGNCSKPKWRDTGYKSPGTTQISPGHISYAPCWFNVAHQLTVSRSLRGWPKSPTIQYLRQNKGSLALLGAVLALIHPQLAVRGFSILRGIQNGEIINVATNSLREERVLWPSPFSAFSILSNRATLLHRDGKGLAPFYDIVTTIGDYVDGRFDVPGIGLRFQYNPGTIIGICGKVLEHGVPEVDGDRFCIVQYFHKKVLEVVAEGFQRNQAFMGWMKQSDFLANVDNCI
jgi:hypothetical protein